MTLRESDGSCAAEPELRVSGLLQPHDLILYFRVDFKQHVAAPVLACRAVRVDDRAPQEP